MFGTHSNLSNVKRTSTVTLRIIYQWTNTRGVKYFSKQPNTSPISPQSVIHRRSSVFQFFVRRAAFSPTGVINSYTPPFWHCFCRRALSEWVCVYVCLCICRHRMCVVSWCFVVLGVIMKLYGRLSVSVCVALLNRIRPRSCAPWQKCTQKYLRCFEWVVQYIHAMG